MTSMEIDFAEVTRQFVAEGADICDQMEEAAIQLETRPTDAELIRSIFRGAHTLKGNASCLAMNELTHVAHALEDIMQALVDQSVVADSQFITLLLRMIDSFRETIPEAAEGRGERRPEQITVLEALEQWRQGQLASHPAAAAAGKTATSGATVSRVQRSLRVDVDRLDRMSNLAGELTIARGRLSRYIEDSHVSTDLQEAFAESERLSQQIQELVTRIRMVPVGTIFRPFVRTIRDLASTQAKKARLVIRGADVEVDLSVVDHLRDPLMHMIRNAVDHGIESPDVRRAKGKAEEGRLTLTARHEGGSIVIEIHDDGQGLDREKIVAKARTLNIEGELDKLSDRDVYRLVLEPGFSTASTVTELSGRGVGMDVVRRNVEALRGSIDIDNRDGAVFTLRLPLTLAIIDGFAVGVADETYILPVDSIVECVAMPPGTRQHEGEGLMDLRGEPLSFIHLATTLGLTTTGVARHVVVVESTAGRIGLAVERLEGQSQTVIKPLGRVFNSVEEFSGSSILSDGRVALVLDIGALVQRALRRRT